jgi:hypothetical protein
MNRRYNLFKTVNVVLSGLWLPWGMFTAYCFGAERYTIASVSLILQTIVASVDGYIWWYCQEHLKGDKS